MQKLLEKYTVVLFRDIDLCFESGNWVRDHICLFADPCSCGTVYWNYAEEENASKNRVWSFDVLYFLYDMCLHKEPTTLFDCLSEVNMSISLYINPIYSSHSPGLLDLSENSFNLSIYWEFVLLYSFCFHQISLGSLIDTFCMVTSGSPVVRVNH